MNRMGEKYLTNEGYIAEIIDYISAINITVLLKDEFKTVLYNIRYGHLKEGRVKNPNYRRIAEVGYFGVGEYKSRVNGKMSKGYDVWKHMIQRCYDSKTQEKYPTYRGVTVCDEWHNFQNFAEWYDKNYKPEYMLDWHLDKDILCGSCKIYSPETCCFVPAEINSLFTKRQNFRGDYPIGANKQLHKYLSKILRYGKQVRLGSYKTPEEAFQAYKVAKEQYIKEVAEEWKDRIDYKVYEAIYNHEVKITD